MPIIILRVNRLLLSVRKCRCKQPSIIKRLKKKKLSQPIQEAKRRKKKKSRGPGGDLHGTLSLDPQKSRFADVTGRGSLFSLHLSVEEYKFIIQPGTGRSPLPLLSSIYRLALGYFSCMVDILLNTSFLDDMGDHSKSKLFLFLLLYCPSGALL